MKVTDYLIAIINFCGSHLYVYKFYTMHCPPAFMRFLILCSSFERSLYIPDML